MTDERARIEELIEVMREHDLDAVRVRTGECTYEVVQRRASSTVTPPPSAPTTPAAPGATPSAATASGPTPSAEAKKVTAPVIGVFYRSPAPGAEPFIEVGDRVAVGQVLCVLEAMKLMNEITSDFAGVVTRILPENGQVVSLGEEMFWIEP